MSFSADIASAYTTDFTLRLNGHTIFENGKITPLGAFIRFLNPIGIMAVLALVNLIISRTGKKFLR